MAKWAKVIVAKPGELIARTHRVEGENLLL